MENRIRSERLRRGLTQTELAARAGISKQLLYKYEHGVIRNIPVDTLRALGRILEVSPGWLAGLEDAVSSMREPMPDNILPLPAMVDTPLVGEIACGTPLLAEENIEAMVPRPENIHADFALRCSGDSMIGARIHDGDIVFIRRQEEVDNGQIAAVLIGEEATLKRVYRDGGTLSLVAENPAYPPMVYIGEQLTQVHILGKAVAFTSALV